MNDASLHEIINIDDLPWRAHEVALILRDQPKVVAQRMQRHAERFNPGGGDLRASKHARVTLPNGYVVSVICCAMFRSNGIDTYEVATFQPNGELATMSGHMSRKDVLAVINQTAMQRAWKNEIT